MENILSSRDWIFYLLQINALWMIGFAAVFVWSRRRHPVMRYYSYLTMYFMLPIALGVSLFVNLGADGKAVDKAMTYNVFYETSVISEIAGPPTLAEDAQAQEQVYSTTLLLLAFVVTFLLSRFISKFVQLFRFAGKEDRAVLGLVSELATEIGVARRVRVLLTRFAITPFSFGWRRPVIVVPELICEKCSPGEIKMILRHELVHIRRNDFLVNVLQKLLRILFIYNPVYHICDRLIDNQRELLCDQEVVALSGVSRKAYAATLLSVTEILYPTAILPAAVPFYRKISQLKERVMLIKDQNKTAVSARHIATIILLVLTSFSAIALSELQAAEDKSQRIFQNEKEHVRITNEFVEITTDMAQNRYGKDSAEYHMWKKRFAMMELSAEDLEQQQAALKADHNLRVKQQQMDLRQQELQVALMQEQLRQERLRRAAGENSQENEAEQDARLKQITEQYHQAIQNYQDINKQQIEALEQKIDDLSANLAENKLAEAEKKETEKSNPTDRSLSDSINEMNQIVNAVRTQLQKDRLIGKREKYFEFVIKDGHCLLDGKRIDDTYLEKYVKLIEDIKGESLTFPHTVSVIKN